MAKDTCWFKKYPVFWFDSSGWRYWITTFPDWRESAYFVPPDIPELVNLQDVKGRGNPYQMRQFLKLVERHSLKLEDDKWKITIFNIFYSEEDAGYIADIPDLEACSAFGHNPKQAFQEVQKTKELWLQAAHAEKKPIPSPKYRPIIYQTTSAWEDLLLTILPNKKHRHGTAAWR